MDNKPHDNLHLSPALCTVSHLLSARVLPSGVQQALTLQVIDGAGLKPEQKAAIIGLRDDHLSHVCTLAAGRRALEASLQQVQPKP